MTAVRGCVLAAEKSAGEKNCVSNGAVYLNKNPPGNITIITWVNNPTHARTNVHKHLQITITDKDMRGNRGLNTQHIIDGIGTRCDTRQVKTNRK